ncbi:MAG: NUDIX hydrolase [Chloroflexota bacterium]
MDIEKTVSSQLIFEGKVIKLRIDTVVMPNGRETQREIIVHRGAVAIVAVDNDDNLLLVRQFRKPAEKVLLEIPAGTLDPGEGPDATALRELQEETGYFPEKMERLGGFYSAPGFCTEFIYLYLATELVPRRLHAEDTDEIELVRVPVAKARELISSGAVCDAKSVAGLLLYLDYRHNL